MGTHDPIAAATQVVMLHCPGGYVGEVINQRWLKVPCRQKRCKAVGAHAHLFDILTGRMSNTPTNEPDSLTPSSARSDSPPAGATPGGAQDHGIR